MKQTKLKPLNIVFITLISVIVLFNLLVIFKAINFPGDWGYIIRWISLGVIFVLAIIYWSLQFSINKVIIRHKRQLSQDSATDNKDNSSQPKD